MKHTRALGRSNAVISRYQKVVENLLPPSTRRRYYYELGLVGIRVILNEGWRNFWSKYKVWLELRKASRKADLYQQWIIENEPGEEKLERYRQESLSFKYRPKVSIIMPIWDAHEKWLRLAIKSVLNQTYDNWELCLVDIGPTKSYIEEILLGYTEKDSRIKVKFHLKNSGISAALNEALSLANGEFVGILNHHDELAPFALYEVVKRLNEKPGLDFIYSDEDRVTYKGKRISPFLKPDWSPHMLLSCMYTGNLSVYRKTIVDELGGFRVEYDDAANYDLALRLTEKTTNVYHIPKILYHNRTKETSPKLIPQTTSQTRNGGKKALENYLARNSIEGEVQTGRWKGCYRVRREVLGSPLISIIIPTKDKVEFLKSCVSSILKKTDYSNYEIIIVDNQSQEKQTLSYYANIEKNPRMRIIKYDAPFNFSAVNNYAVSQANGDYLLFLNNDTKVISEEWLSAMMEHAQSKEVGAVGCLLLYPNDKIQHAGVIVGSGLPGRHSHRYMPASNPGYYLRPHLVHNVSAITAACMLIRKQVFQEVGGFDENLPVTWNDIDICLKIRNKGYLIVYTPYAKLYHPECTTRGYDNTPEKQRRVRKEEVYMKLKWGRVLNAVDPYYNPGLTMTGDNFALRSSLEETIRSGILLSALDMSNVDGLASLLYESVNGKTNNPITRLWYEVYLRRPDLQKAFPDIFGAHQEAFLDWVLTHGRDEYPGFEMDSEQVLARSPINARSPVEPGINVVGYITGEFGIGAGVRALIRAMQEGGIPYVLNNIISPVHRSQDFTFRNLSAVNPYAINLICVNADEIIYLLARKGLSYFIGKYNIGFWAWELSRFPEEWVGSFKYYDELWVPSNFCLESVASVSTIPVTKIYCVNMDEGKIDISRSRFGLNEDSYIFIFNFDFNSYLQRKNPQAVVKAFTKAFDRNENVVLVLKYINHIYHPKETRILEDLTKRVPNIKVIDTHLKKDDLYSLIASCDCYVSLHRSEGFGLTIAEAMYLRRPVIATGYSGNMDFMNVDNSFPIKYKLIEVGEDDYPPFRKGYVWAEPDIEHAAEVMRFVYENREYAAKIGEKASEDIKRCLSPAVAGREIRRRLEKILQDR